jgi:hypothetical protein
MAGWGIVPLHDGFPSIRTMRRCSAATRRAVQATRPAALDLRFARHQPRRLDSTISIIVSQGGNSAGRDRGCSFRQCDAPEAMR